jgi:diguanylate cyclase (GGDEF)-like protein
LKRGLENLQLDELTEVYSFKSFLKVMEKLLNTNRNNRYSVVVWNVVHFKYVNEMFGMDFGDMILYQVARLFPNDYHSQCITGRIGNDIFISCFQKGRYSLDDIKAKLCYRVQDANEIIRIIMQAGIYDIEDNSHPAINICDRALIALNSIHGKYTDRVAFYEDTVRVALATEIQLLSDFLDGIKRNEFYTVIQPVFCIADNRISSGEVLVRWNHPSKGLIMPNVFITMLEETYLITMLDYYVWEEACKLIQQMQQKSMNPIPLSVNISRINLYNEDLGVKLDELLARYRIPHNLLRLEITESAYTDNPEQFLKIIFDLKKRGYFIIMDDLGNGYSSLKLIKDFPFHTLKIDKSLIDEVEISSRAKDIVSCIINMSKSLNMNVVAEGIENECQAICLRSLGCDYSQGFFYAKPLDQNTFLNAYVQKII